ncbi:MAG: tRNA preQ1(34) S-adenosylmethionine ribosyltransferase-isomerase QueA [Planctomycetota bacterium]
MQLTDFDFILPESQIARVPAGRRDESRLCVFDRATKITQDRKFKDLCDFIRAGDLIVMNDVRVIRARVELERPTGSRFEGLLIRVDGESVEIMADGAARIKPGESFPFVKDRSMRLEFLERRGEAWAARVAGASGADWLERIGSVPIPPYIRKARKRAGESEAELEPLDRERYQTVFAAEGAAVAAPTAGLHFTNELLNSIIQKNAKIVTIRLDVGPGTFASIRVDNFKDHRIAPEQFDISAETAAAINETKNRGGRVFAVGTTTVRTLEYAVRETGSVAAGTGASDLFIYPDYKFKVVDALITNFHLPQSTLLMLVCAFAGTRETLELYQHAVRENYRFYSYGDAMLIL